MSKRAPLRALLPLAFVGLIPAACGGSSTPPATAPAPVASASAVPVATSATPPAAVPAPGAQYDEAALDKSVAPCDDFYQYACGGWLKATPIPEDKAVWSRGFSVLAEANAVTMRKILEDASSGHGDADNPYAKKMGDLYASCMDEPAIEKRGLGELKGELARANAAKDPASLAKEIAHLQSLDVGAAFDMGSETDQKDAKQTIAAIAQSGLTLPDRDYYVNDDARSVEMRQKMQAHVEAMFVLAGEPAAKAKADAAAVVKFETDLAKPQMSRVDRRDPDKTYHPMDRKALAALAPTFKWDVYFKELGYPGIQSLDVVQPDYFKALDGLVKTAPMATWQTYLRWHALHAAAPSLPKAFVDEDFRFQQLLTGAKVMEPRWRRCVRGVDRMMGEALGRTFAKTALGEDGKAAVEKMVDELLVSMGDDIDHVAWMDDVTRAKAKTKLATFAKEIGYPAKWRTYDALTIERPDYLGNVLRARAFNAKHDRDKAGKPSNREEWDMTPATINAYYRPDFNDISFPAGILQKPFFSVSQPLATNFGGIGMVMGHEITHGFDDEGRKFDADGSRRDWWTPASSAEFDKRADCVATQYDGYEPLPGKHINGKLTLGENIADLGGLKVALASLHRAEGADVSVAGDQTFFFGFAQSWCENMREERQRMLLTIDPHSPSRFRVDGELANMPEFAAAFQCVAGSKMVNANRCEIW